MTAGPANERATTTCARAPIGGITTCRSRHVGSAPRPGRPGPARRSPHRGSRIGWSSRRAARSSPSRTEHRQHQTRNPASGARGRRRHVVSSPPGPPDRRGTPRALCTCERMGPGPRNPRSRLRSSAATSPWPARGSGTPSGCPKDHHSTWSTGSWPVVPSGRPDRSVGRARSDHHTPAGILADRAGLDAIELGNGVVHDLPIGARHDLEHDLRRLRPPCPRPRSRTRRATPVDARGPRRCRRSPSRTRGRRPDVGGCSGTFPGSHRGCRVVGRRADPDSSPFTTVTRRTPSSSSSALTSALSPNASTSPVMNCSAVCTCSAASIVPRSVFDPLRSASLRPLDRLAAGADLAAAATFGASSSRTATDPASPEPVASAPVRPPRRLRPAPSFWLPRRRSFLGGGAFGTTRARTRPVPRVRPKRPAFGSSTTSNSASASSTPRWSRASSLASSIGLACCLYPFHGAHPFSGFEVFRGSPERR